MRWWVRLFKKTKPLVPPPAEGQLALDRGLNKMAEIDARWTQIHSTTDPLRKYRTENRLAEQIESIFKQRGD